MIYEYVSLMFGILKLFLFKLLNFNRVKFIYVPKMNASFRIAIKKYSKIIFGKNFRARNNVSFRIYNKGIVKIGNDCFMNDGCSINCQKSIEIGNNVIFGQNVMLFDHDHDYKNNMNEFIRKNIKIGNNVWIGANSVILKGVTIGNDVVIGANTLINKDVPDNQIIYQEKTIKTKEKD